MADESNEERRINICSQCLNSLVENTSPGFHRRYAWCSAFKCARCNLDVYACTDCPKNGKVGYLRMKKLSLRGHHKKFHQDADNHESGKKRKHEVSDDVVNTSFDDEDVQMAADDDDGDRRHIPPSSQPKYSTCVYRLGDSLSDFFERKESSTFYEEEAFGSGRGYRRIVGKALYPDSPQHTQQLTDADVKLHIDIAILLDSLPSTHHERLFSIIRQSESNSQLRTLYSELRTSPSTTTSHPVEQTSSSCSRSSSTNEEPPFVCRKTSYQDIHRIYFQGKHGIVKNLPHPTVKTIGNFAYVPLREAVRDLLAYEHTKLDIPFVNSVPPGYKAVHVEKLSESKKGRQILSDLRRKYKNKVLPIYVIKWSDGYDPLNSKKNRGSHWIMTLSFAPPDSRHFHTDNTYPIAIGPDKSSHLPVLAKIKEEWYDMESKVETELFYYAREKSFVHVSLTYIAIVQDSPERTSDSMTPACNSRFGRYFGHSVDYNTVWNKIKPCDSCKLQFEGKYDALATSVPCNICTRWDIKAGSPLLAFKPLPDFPKDEIPDDGELPCLALSFPLMIAKYEYAYSKHLKDKHWTEKRLKDYCSYYGMKAELIELVIEDVKKKKSILAVFTEMERSAELKQKLIDLEVGFLFDYSTEEFDEYLNKAPDHPPTWNSGYTFQEMAPSTMHSLTLNCGKNTIKFVRKLLVILKLEASFHRYATMVTESLMNLGLPWLDMLPWEKRGGYVSENWLALMRVSKYFMAGASSLTQKYKYIEPTKERNKWNKKEKVDWLKARGFKIAKTMLVKDIDVILKAEMDLPMNQRRPVVMERNFDRRIVSKLVASYFGLTGCVLIKSTVEGETGKECEWRVKQFLTNLHSFEEVIDRINPEKKDSDDASLPVWCTSFSYVNLLSFPQALENWGPMRNLWEGGVIGEGFLRSVKPLAPRHASHSFHLLLTRFLRDRSLRRYRTAAEQLDNLSEGVTIEGLGDCRIYKKEEDVTKLVREHAPLCVVRLTEKVDKKRGRFVMLVRREIRNIGTEDVAANDCGFLGLLALNLVRTRFLGIFEGMPFFDWSVHSNDLSSIDTSKYEIEHSCLLLPSLPEFGVPHSPANYGSYYTITSEYLEMSPDGNFKRGEDYENSN